MRYSEDNLQISDLAKYGQVSDWSSSFYVFVEKR